MKIKDGMRTVNVENESGEIIGVWKFNPNDIGLISRATELQKKLESYDTDNIVDAEKKLKDGMDECFGGGFSKAFFSTCSPLSVVDGELFVQSVLKSVLDYIEPLMRKAIESSSARIQKYTEGIE